MTVEVDHAAVRQHLEQQFMATAERLPTLFDLDDQSMQLMGLLEDVTDPEAAAELEGALALIDQMMVQKVEGYVSVIRSLESMSAARKAEADRLRDRAKTAERHADWLKNRLMVHLQTTGRERVETARFTLALRQNPPAVNVLDAAAVPSEYQRTKIEIAPDKTAILAAFKKDGEIVPGTSIERSTRLAIS